MRRSKIVFFFALIAALFCGTAWAEAVFDASMDIDGEFPTAYTTSTWYDNYVSVSGGDSGYKFTIMSGDLPPDFYISQSEGYFYLRGIPNTPGTWDFTLRAADWRDHYTEKVFSVTVAGELFEASSDDMSFSTEGYYDEEYNHHYYPGFKTSGTAGESYSSRIYVNGGKGSYTFSTSGAIPPGLSVMQSGSYFYLEGIPTTPGTNTFVLRVIDGRGAYIDIPSTISIAEGSYTAPSEADDMAIAGSITTEIRVNGSYSSSLTLSGAENRTCRWMISKGELPPGLYLSSSSSNSVSINGKANTAGEYTFTVRGIDSDTNTYAEREFTIKVNETPVNDSAMSFSGVFTSEWKMNEEYSSNISLSGHSGNVYLTVTSGDIPPGLTLRTGSYYSSSSSITCYLSGTPSTSGTYTFTLRATDSRYHYAEKDFTVKINDIPYLAADMSVTGEFPPEWRMNEYYYSGYYSGYYRYGYSSGYVVSVSGGTGTKYVNVVKGELPPGLSLRLDNSYIYLYGIPNTAGSYMFTLRITDSRNAYTDAVFTVKINDTPYSASDMSITGDFAAEWKVNENNSTSATITGALTTSRYFTDLHMTVASGDLPPGLSLSTSTKSEYDYSEGRSRYTGNCELYGIPSAPGTYTFTLRATDYRNAYAEKDFTVTVSGDKPADPSSAADMSLSGSFPESYTLSTWYSQSVQVSGGTPSYSFSISGGALPPGFYIRQDNGTFYLEGVPNTAGEYKFTLRVIDRRNAYTEKEYTVKINGDHTKGDGMSITGRLPDAYTTSSWYTNSTPLKIVGGNGTYTFKITSGGLPPGFYVRQGTPRYSSVYYDDSGRYYTYNNENFYVEGIPTKPGTYTFTLQITDSSDKYVERNLTLNVYGNELTVPEPADPVKITTTSLKNALMGEAYSQDITYAGTATSWSITSGDLPAGLSLDASTGKISGTVADTAIDHNAASAKAYTFTVLAANASGGKSSQTLTISVSERVHFTTDAALPNGKVGEPYEATINVSGTAVDSISRYNTTLPSGLSYISTGRTVIISGMPERAGTYQLRFYASNSWTSDNKMFTLTIEQRADPVEIMTSYIEPAGTGTEYSFAFTASGDATLWQVSGDLPEGLSLDTVKGVIGGTVSENVLEKYSGKNYYPSKTYSFTVTVSNSTGGIDSRNLSMTVYAPVKILTDTLADAQAEQEYNAEIEITGTGMYRYNDTYTSYSFYAPAYSVSGMPEGLSYYQADNGNIRLNGKPAQQGTYSIAIQLRNNYSSQDKTFELYVAPKPAPTPKPQIIVPDNYDGILEAGKNYSFKFRVAGTKPVISTSGTLPAGLSFDTSTCTLSGTVTPVDSGKYSHSQLSYRFTIIAKNSGGTDSATVNMSVYYPPSIVTGTALPEGEISTLYNQEITAEGTEASMTWKKTSGNLPAGLKLITNNNSRTCAITGVPTKTGTYNFTLSLSALIGFTTETTKKEFTITVNDVSDTGEGGPVISTASLPAGTLGGIYFEVLEATGQKPITWKKSGSFPSGLTFDTKSGTISGIPKKAGTYTFTVTASNKVNKKTVKTSQTFTIEITGDIYKKPSISSVKAPAATVDQPYSLQLSAVGTNTAECPITWSFANNKYPAGLMIDSETGLISGTPKEIGNFSVKVKAENNIGSATKSISIKVNGEAPEILNEELAGGTAGESYSEQLVANGTNTSKIAITWTASGLPSGLRVTDKKAGIISGTPRKAGTFNVKITAKNKYGRRIKTFTMTVADAAASALPENEPSETESPEEIAYSTSDSEPQDYAVTEEYSQAEIDTGVYANNSEIDMYVVSGDEELRGEIYAPEGKPLTFVIGTWPGAVNDSDIVIFIADEATEIEADDNTFTIPGELVKDEFVIYAKAGDMKTIELYVVAETEEE